MYDRGTKSRADIPDPYPYEWIIESYGELNTCRDFAAGGPIPFTAVAEFAKIMGVQEFDVLLYGVRVLDRVFMEEKNGNEKES